MAICQQKKFWSLSRLCDVMEVVGVFAPLKEFGNRNRLKLCKKMYVNDFVHVVLYFFIELNIQIRHLSYDKAAVMHRMQKQIHSISKKFK